MTSALSRDDAALGRRVRSALQAFTTGTRLGGVARDKQAIAMIGSRYPKALSVFPKSALLAVLREPGDKCSWDAYRDLAASNGEPAPKPSTVLESLLGRPCDRWCKPAFDTARVAKRERAMLAAAAQHPPTAATGFLWPAGSEPVGLVAAARAAARRQPPPPSYYQPRRRS
jgi:hypothetical protein